MTTPSITASAFHGAASGGGSPRNITLVIGKPTVGVNRVLVVVTSINDDGDLVTGINVGGAASTAMVQGGNGTFMQNAAFAKLNPITDGSGNATVSIDCSGDGAYAPIVWWYVVSDVDATTPWTDATAGGVPSASSASPSTGSITVPADGLLVAAMNHNYSDTYSCTGGTEVVHGLTISKPYAIAYRTTTGAVTWTTQYSNVWQASAILFAGASGGGGGATATTLTGPTSGTTGVASSNFTVGANGTITGTVTVTPSATGGGTFSPTSVAISSGTPTGTFTYTPGSDGAKTISTTNDGGLTNPTSITYTASAGADVTAPILSSPIGAQTGSTTASGGVTTDEANGTLYYVCTTSGTPPTEAQVKTGKDSAGATAKYAGSQAITTSGAKTFAAAGLTYSTAYFWHNMHEDTAGNQSTVSSSATFTTAAVAGVITSQAFKNWSPSTLASITVPNVAILKASDRTLVLALTGQTTDGSGVMTITNAAIVPGTKYMLATWENDTSAYGCEPVIAT